MKWDFVAKERNSAERSRVSKVIVTYSISVNPWPLMPLTLNERPFKPLESMPNITYNSNQKTIGDGVQGRAWSNSFGLFLLAPHSTVFLIALLRVTLQCNDLVILRSSLERSSCCARPLLALSSLAQSSSLMEASITSPFKLLNDCNI